MLLWTEKSAEERLRSDSYLLFPIKSWQRLVMPFIVDIELRQPDDVIYTGLEPLRPWFSIQQFCMFMNAVTYLDLGYTYFIMLARAMQIPSAQTRDVLVGIRASGTIPVHGCKKHNSYMMDPIQHMMLLTNVSDYKVQPLPPLPRILTRVIRVGISVICTLGCCYDFAGKGISIFKKSTH